MSTQQSPVAGRALGSSDGDWVELAHAGSPGSLSLEQAPTSDSLPATGSNASDMETSPQAIHVSQIQRAPVPRITDPGELLFQQHSVARAGSQYEYETQKEFKRLHDAALHGESNGVIGTFTDAANEIVKNRWIEQGIWNSKWSPLSVGRWKHEEPLELESESETDNETDVHIPAIFSKHGKRPKRRRPKSDDEKRRIAERLAVRARERETSRPFHQFIYQISKERERIVKESGDGKGAPPLDVNTKAYENVKNKWIERYFWIEEWGGILPGMSWRHEWPRSEEDEKIDAELDVFARENDARDARNAQEWAQ